MAVYNRTDSLPEEVASLEKDIQEYKSTQIVGNDNLIVYFDADNLISQSVSSGVTALFKATYTFDEPSTAYVDRTIFFNVTSGSFFYTDYPYDDPSTTTSTTAKSWFYAITTDSSATLEIVAVARSTQHGTLSLVRIT
jgi:hypothetical protein